MPEKKEYRRQCPECKKDLVYSSLRWYLHAKLKGGKCNYCSNVIRGKSSNRKGMKHSSETKRLMSLSKMGVKKSVITRSKMSEFQKNRYSDLCEIQKTSNVVKVAMRRPDVRKRHLEALHHSKWLKVRTDKGQLELINKWNRLGFDFEPNYQIHTDADLFYVDGYDKKKNVVLEYDSKYHKKSSQKEKDSIRQKKIINILNPKKFWRYDSDIGKMRNVLGDFNNV